MGGGHSKQSQVQSLKKSITDIDKAVLDLKIARDKLNRLIHKIDVDAEQLLQRSKDAYTRDQRNIAVGLLRLRKFKLNQVDSIHNQLFTIAQLTSHIESKEQEKEVLAALKSGKEALEKLNSIYSLEEIVKLMDHVQEQSELEREINSVLISTGENTLSSLQESEVEAEFLALTQGQPLHLPVAPVGSLPSVSIVHVSMDSTSTTEQPVMIPG